MYRNIILALIVLIFFAFSLSGSEASDKNIYVDSFGLESGQGDVDNPFNSIEKAILAARKFKHKTVNIFLRDGYYFIQKTIQLSEKDDRKEGFPLTISAYKGEKVTIAGAIPLSDWHKLTDENIIERLRNDVISHIYVTDLHKYGITEFGSPEGSGVYLYHNDSRMQLARYPNQGLLKIEKLVEPNTKVVRNRKGSDVGKFYYSGDEPERWSKESEIWLDGYWFWDWKDEIQRVEEIDLKHKIIEIAKPYHYYGYRKSQEYYAFNILAELDAPEEWYLDRDSGKLYFYPDASLDEGEPPILSVIYDLVELKNVSNIRIKNLVFSYSKHDGVVIDGGKDNLIEGVVVKNIGDNAVVIRDSNNSKIVSSHIYSVGAGAIAIAGGDRNLLVDANICAISNEIHDYAKVKRTYQSGISLRGVGNCARNNEIYNAPHAAITFKGNNHHIEYNDIHDVVTQSNDAGAIYAGRDWSSRGVMIRNNYFHNIQGYHGDGAKSIYLDDEFSGVTVFGNIFDNVHDGVFVGGGRDNLIFGNLFVNVFRSISIDARGIGWAAYQGNQLISKLNDVPYKSDAWLKQYPSLPNVLTLHPRLPVGNIVANNVFFDENWKFISPEAEPYVDFIDNYHISRNELKDNYQVNAKLLGFDNIPFDRIGVR